MPFSDNARSTLWLLDDDGLWYNSSISGSLAGALAIKRLTARLIGFGGTRCALSSADRQSARNTRARFQLFNPSLHCRTFGQLDSLLYPTFRPWQAGDVGNREPARHIFAARKLAIQYAIDKIGRAESRGRRCR